MLKLLRKRKISKRILYVLAALIIPAFIIWGSTSVINKSGTPDYAGTIFGRKVSLDEFRDAMHAWKTQMRLQYGEKAEEVASSFFDPVQAAWDRLILLHETKQRKIKIPDDAVVGAIVRMPFLQKDNRFDSPSYDLFLRYSLGVRPKIFEEHLRQNLAMATLFQQVTADTRISEDEIKEAYERQNVRTRVKYVFFPIQGYRDKVTVNDEEIGAYYEKNKEEFKIQPQINVAYIGLDFSEETPREEKKQAAEKLKTVLARARQKGLFDAARESGLEVKETGLFGFQDPIPTLGWMPHVSDILFGLEADDFSKVIENSRGNYLFQLKEKKEAYIPELAEAKGKVKEALLNEKSKEMAAQKAKGFLAQIREQSLSLEKAAENEGLQVKETPAFSYEEYIPELGMAKPLKDAAFKLKAGETAPDAVEIQQGFCVLSSVDTTPLDEEKFKKEKEEFSSQLLEQKKNKVFNAFFEDLKKRARLASHIPAAK